MDIAALFAAVAALAAVGALFATLRRGGGTADLLARLDRLEAAMREAQKGGADLVVAQVEKGLEAKHRELSDATRDLLLRQERELRALTEAKLDQVREAIGQLKAEMAKTLADLRQGLTHSLGEQMATGTGRTLQSVAETMKLATDTLNKRFAELQAVTDSKLTEISGKVTERLDEGFKKTTETFTDVVTRLTIIDKAQEKIAALSNEVVSLQEILSDKKSRGVFGEVQLNHLVMNAMPEGAYALQHTLAEGRIADCVLYLPEPTGTVAVDAKFPLENFRRMFDRETPEAERVQAERQFKQDVKKHITDIATKYIIPGVTADGAVMFIPAEAVFAEIHAHHPDLVDLAQRNRVSITSPTTMWAVLNTMRSVLKDAKTREQVHIIQEHLRFLATDFGRFQERMDKLAQHIRQTKDDVDQVHVSAKKITSRFEKIERVQLDGVEPAPTALEAAAGANPEAD